MGGVWLLGSELPVAPEFRDDLTLESLGRVEASTAPDPEGGPLKTPKSRPKRLRYIPASEGGAVANTV